MMDFAIMNFFCFRFLASSSSWLAFEYFPISEPKSNPIRPIADADIRVDKHTILSPSVNPKKLKEPGSGRVWVVIKNPPFDI